MMPILALMQLDTIAAYLQQSVGFEDIEFNV